MQPYLRSYLLVLLFAYPLFLRAQIVHEIPYSLAISPTDTTRILNDIRAAEQIIDSYPDSAAWTLTASLLRSKEYLFPEGIMRSMLALGMTARKKQSYATAENWLKQAGSFFPLSGLDSTFYVRLLNNLGSVSNDRGAYEAAVRHYYSAIAICSNKKDTIWVRLLMNTYINLSNTLMRNDNAHQALHYLELGQAIATEYRDTAALLAIFLNKGLALYVKDDVEQALHYLNKSSMLSLHMDNVAMEVKINNNMGLMLQKKGLNKEAVSYFRKALALSDSVSDGYHYILTSANLGYSLFLLHDYTSAEHYLLLSIRLSERTGLKDGTIAAYYYLARTYNKTGRNDLAYSYQEKYVKLLEEYFNKDKAKAISELEIKYQTAVNAKELSDKKLLVEAQYRRIEKQEKLIIMVTSITIFALLFFSLLFIQKARLNKERMSRMKKEQQILSLSNLMAGEEKERRRIAEELHDGIGGMLAAFKMNFHSFLEKFSVTKEESFYELMSMLDDTSKEVRRTSHNLMPDILIRYGLAEALRRYIAGITNKNKLMIDLQIVGHPDFADKSLELSLYRILQELIQNIVKHAEATHALVQVNQQDNIISILVEDNGIGHGLMEEPDGIGLNNIRNRVQSFEGKIDIQAGAGKGMMVYLEFYTDRVQKNLS